MNTTEIILGYNKKTEVLELFGEYTKMLCDSMPEVREYLELQNLEAEMADLTLKYGLPKGRLYVVYYKGELAGCGAFKPIFENDCEMKRLYIRPEFRGKGLGRLTAETLIEDASALGYKHMYLDTLPFLKKAIKMYRGFGFYEIESYNNSPLECTIYMKLDLKGN